MIVTNALYAEIDRLTAQITKLEAEKDKLRDDLSMDNAILQNLLYREREEKRAIEDAMTDLQAAYNHLRARVGELEAEIKRMREHTWCAYCGLEIHIDDDAATLISEHILSCDKHPLHIALADNDHLKARVKELKAERDGYRNGQMQLQDTLSTVMDSNAKWAAENKRLCNRIAELEAEMREIGVGE